jgi:hypothetical protein
VSDVPKDAVVVVDRVVHGVVDRVVDRAVVHDRVVHRVVVHGPPVVVPTVVALESSNGQQPHGDRPEVEVVPDDVMVVEVMAVRHGRQGRGAGVRDPRCPDGGEGCEPDDSYGVTDDAASR